MSISFPSCLASFVAAAALGLSANAMAAPVSLGSYTFDSALFGNTLVHGDGGTFAAGNWLNTANADPGSPGYLTGANFNTGVANITGQSFTIGYSTGILNGSGTDLAVVSARYDSNPFMLTINGISVAYSAGEGVGTGVSMPYYYGIGNGPYPADLFVTSIDLSDFGVGAGSSINSISIVGYTGFDLIRVAGFTAAAVEPGEVPEPGSLALLGLGLIGLAAARKRKQA